MKFDASIGGPPDLRVIRLDGVLATKSLGVYSSSIYSLALQIDTYGLRTLQRQLQIAACIADVVRVTIDIERDRPATLGDLCNAVEDGLACRVDDAASRT